MPKIYLALLLSLCVSCTKGRDFPAYFYTASASTLPTPAGEENAMTLTVSTDYEEGEMGEVPEETHSVCAIPTSTPIGSTVTCEAEIPEGQLYFSTTTWTINVNAGYCDIVYFRPYYYQMSVGAAFQPDWEDAAIDCSVTPAPATCYNGPATTIVSGFPDFTYMYFIPGGQAISQAFSVDSGNLKLRGSNRWVANNLQSGSRSATFATPTDAYLAGSFQDYELECIDKYLTRQYHVVLTISDIDHGVNPNVPCGGINQRCDWSDY